MAIKPKDNSLKLYYDKESTLQAVSYLCSYLYTLNIKFRFNMVVKLILNRYANDKHIF